MAAKVVFLRSKSPAGVEPRVDKEARALAAAGYEVHVVLWDRTLEHVPEEEREGYRIHRVRIPAPEGQPALVLKMPRWWLAAWKLLGGLRPDAVHAIDLDCLLPALAAKRMLRAKLVYDIFDFYAPMIAVNLPEWIRNALTRFERRWALHADLVILPDISRADFFDPARPPAILEVMNVPEERGVAARPREIFTVFYGGQIARDRGLLELVRACEAVGARLVVAGHGPDEATLIPEVESSPAAEYVGTLPYDEVLSWTASSDLIAALYDPSIPNNRRASPNKLYEAMMLGKPVLTNEGTLVGDFVRREGLGAVATYGDVESVRTALESLMLSPAACQEMGARGRRLYEERFRWEAMRDRLVSAYRVLLGA